MDLQSRVSDRLRDHISRHDDVQMFAGYGTGVFAACISSLARAYLVVGRCCQQSLVQPPPNPKLRASPRITPRCCLGRPIGTQAVRTLPPCFPASSSSESACRQALGPASRIGSPASVTPPFWNHARNPSGPTHRNVSAHASVPVGELTSDQVVEAANESSPRRCCSFCPVSEGLPSHTG
jgi:hypothetical protein